MEKQKKVKEPPKYPEIGARLSQFIEDSGEPNARQFALKAGLTPQLVSHLAGGYSIPGGETLMALATAYRSFDSDWLLTGRRKGQAADQLPPAIPSEAKPATAPTPGYPIMAVARITPEEAVAIQLENARLKQELETQTQLIAELRADKGQLWKQNAILLEKKPEASVDAAPLTDTVDEVAHEFLAAELPEFRRYVPRKPADRPVVTGFHLSVA